MNFFRITGDVLHLLSILILLYRISKYRSCGGVSLKTQILYLTVFATRYLDLLLIWTHSLDGLQMYNSIMKVFFLSSTGYTVFLIGKKFRVSYDKEHDSFNLLWVLAPCAVLSLIFNQEFTIMEVLWAFSIFLEAVAILPQLWMLQKQRNAENFTLLYIFCLGAYRGLYILNWLYRATTEANFFTSENFFHTLAFVSGIIQTVLYSDFFYHYVKSVREGRTFSLPN